MVLKTTRKHANSLKDQTREKMRLLMALYGFGEYHDRFVLVFFFFLNACRPLAQIMPTLMAKNVAMCQDIKLKRNNEKCNIASKFK